MLPRHDQLFRKVSIFIFFSWVMIFGFLPNLLMLGMSFLKNSETSLVLFELTIENYLAFLNPAYLKVIGRSIVLSAVTTGCCFLAGYPFAYCLSQISRSYKTLLLLLLIIPLWTSSLIRTYAMVALLKVHGPLNELLLWLGWIKQPLQWLYSDVAVLAGMVYSLFPFMVLPIYTNLEKLDRNILEAAQDLGAGKRVVLFKILLPLTLPGVVAGCLFVFLPAMTLFYIPEILGGAKTLHLGHLIQNQFLLLQNWPMGAVLNMILILIMGVIFYLYWKVSQKNKRQDLL